MRYFLYNLVWYTKDIPNRMFFKRVFVDGLERLPKDVPILFVANHAGSFLDGVLINFFTGAPVFPLARGDAFRRPIYNRMLRSLRILPIFRARDADPGTAKKGNRITWEECFDLFKQKQRVLIFPEASSEPDKFLRPLRKGAGNLAADAMLRFHGKLDLYVVPCGINFSGFFKRRMRVHIGIGEAWRMKDLWDEIQGDPRRFGARITQEFEERIHALTVDTRGPEHHELELLHDMLLNECDTVEGFLAQHRGADLIASRIRNASNSVRNDLGEYRSLLERHGLDDRSVQGSEIPYVTMMFCLLTAYVSLPAAVLLQGVWAIAKKWAEWTSPNPRFTDSIHFGIGYILMWIWFPLTALALYWYLPAEWLMGWKLAAFALAIGLASSWQVFGEEIQKLKMRWRYEALSEDLRYKLKDLRTQILNSL